MITEDYVSFEVAKLLKDRGFDISVRYEYHSVHNINQKPQFHRHLHNFNGEEYSRLRSKWYSAPTLQMACKWLREVYNACICINMVGNEDDSYILFTYNIYQNKNYKLIFGSNVPKYNSYEEAVEAAIKYTLENLI